MDTDREITVRTGTRYLSHLVKIETDMTDEHVARLLDQLEFLTAHPERHDQTTWYFLGEEHKLPQDMEQADSLVPVRHQVGSIQNCGTVACLAGWTVLRTESIPLVRDRGGNIFPGVQGLDGSWFSVETEDAATRYLGLSTLNAGALFDGNNTLADLWQLSAVITGARIKLPGKFRSRQRQHDRLAAELLTYAEMD